MHAHNLEQAKMEALLHQIVAEEQARMKQLGFIETFIPSPESNAKCAIFMSPNWHIAHRLLLIIVSGNGIQPGIWSRSLVLEPHENPNAYRSGSMLPYVHTAIAKGYGVIVMNPSTNTIITPEGEKIPIPCSSSPEMHVDYVWSTYCAHAACAQVYIAAYGRGGALAKHLMCTQNVLRQKLAAIAFIESSHRVAPDDSEEVRQLLTTRTINWQRSREPAGTQLQDGAQLGCLSLSAGDPQSSISLSAGSTEAKKSSNTAWTIGASLDTVFAFFDSARGSVRTDSQFAGGDEDDDMDGILQEEMSRLSDYAYAGAAAISNMSASYLYEHQDDEEPVQNKGSISSDRRSSRDRRSMVISTSMSVNDFDLLSVVGKGAYGKVFLAKKKTGRNKNRIYAMKVLRKSDVFQKKQVEHTKSEQRILKHVEHPFVVRLRYAFQNEMKLYLVMDYYSGGSLFVHLRKAPLRRFDELRAKFYAAELLLSLAHLHHLRIMYRDLKLENILMDSEGHIAITDFGLSKEDDEGSTFVGTPEYLAPELLSSQRTFTSYGKSVDWWSYGVLVYEMIDGSTPFYDKNRRTMFQKILQQNPIFSDEKFSPVAKDFCQWLLVKDPTKRMGCGPEGPLEIMRHPWFAGVDWDLVLQRRIEPPFKPNEGRGSLNGQLAYVPSVFSSQSVADSPVTSSGMGMSANTQAMMHFDDFSYMGSEAHLGSRRTSLFRESDLKMDLE